MWNFRKIKFSSFYYHEYWRKYVKIKFWFYLVGFWSCFPYISQSHPGIILKLVCIDWFWSKRIETQVKILGNSFGKLLSFRLYVLQGQLSTAMYFVSSDPVSPYPGLAYRTQWRGPTQHEIDHLLFIWDNLGWIISSGSRHLPTRKWHLLTEISPVPTPSIDPKHQSFVGFWTLSLGLH